MSMLARLINHFLLSNLTPFASSNLRLRYDGTQHYNHNGSDQRMVPLTDANRASAERDDEYKERSY